MSFMYKKITGPVVTLLSLITLPEVQASKYIERMSPEDTVTMAKYVAGKEYTPNSPFSVDREKSLTDSTVSHKRNSEYRALLLRKDSLLSKELESWLNQSGYTLLWNSNRDYIIYNTITFQADKFDNVLNELGELFESENYGLVIKQYEVNKVIIIDSQ